MPQTLLYFVLLLSAAICSENTVKFGAENSVKQTSVCTDQDLPGEDEGNGYAVLRECYLPTIELTHFLLATRPKYPTFESDSFSHSIRAPPAYS